VTDHPKLVSARHMKKSTRWGTPSEWVEMARSAMGGIELDPMSEAKFNATVRAERFYDRDAFDRSWQCSTMLLNPDGRFTKEAWIRLASQFAAGMIGQAIWIGFSIEQVCWMCDLNPSPLDFSVLFCRNRISFNPHEGDNDRPSHANYVAALGVPVSRFEAAFAGRGKFMHG
jgi:hypothetical protein